MFKGTVYRTVESGCEGGGDTAHTPGHNHIIVLETENEFISHDFSIKVRTEVHFGVDRANLKCQDLIFIHYQDMDNNCF